MLPGMTAPVNKASSQAVSNAQRPVINSPADLNVIHSKEHQERNALRINKLQEAVKMALNVQGSDYIRSSFFRALLDGPTDIDSECGYPSSITPDHYRKMYDREGIAKRVVNCEPDETWAMDPEIYEDDDPDK